MKSKKKKSLFKAFLGISAVLFSCLVIAAIVLGIYINKNFERELPSDFLKASIKAESPRFFAAML